LTRTAGTTLSVEGWIAGYLGGVTEQWLKVAPFSNPAMLEMLRDRDRPPYRDLLPWSGEFAGKYLTSAVQVYRVTGDESLRGVIAEFVGRLTALQADDGYLGPWPQDSRLIGSASNGGLQLEGGYGADDLKTWDAWGHYQAMLGLLLWFEETGDGTALTCARRIGDLLCDIFEHRPLVDLDPGRPEANTTQMNQAPIHSLCLLYGHTGDERYLRQAMKIRDEFGTVADDGTPVAGDYLHATLAGKEFFELPTPRWESLHPVMGLAELAAITGDAPSREAFEAIWWSIVKGDRHNNGGFSSGEQATGNPYDRGAIETCCTIAWIALSVEMLRLTGDPVVADELELSTLNSVVGMHAPNGRWVTYDTPMDGARYASAHHISFQCREGSPELNCCSVNGPRGFGMISDWALMASDDDVVLNWYGPGSMTAPVQDGELTLRQQTEYPRDNGVRIAIEVDEPRAFALRLRIPSWSAATEVRLNGEVVAGVEPGTYLALEREWRTGDEIDIAFDFSLQYWVGERECDGKVSIYRGPILLTYDRRFDAANRVDPPALDARGLSGTIVGFDEWLPPLLLLEFPAVDGSVVRLCDFGSAGVGGSRYRSWLDVDSCTPTEFTRANARRTALVAP
jgi:DUF1680 family protein